MIKSERIPRMIVFVAAIRRKWSRENRDERNRRRRVGRKVEM